MAANSKKPFLLRINPKVLAGVQQLAAIELRSTNSQIEIILAEALKRRGISHAPDSQIPQIDEKSGNN
jgi:hypothetical protein